MALVRKDRSAAGIFLAAILGGVAAAVVGGVALGLIVKWTDYEIGFAAWGMGFLTGAAVLVATRGTRGIALRIVAVACALLGIGLGKYLSFAWVLQERAVESEFPVFSRDTLDFFFDNLGFVFDWIDLLWVGLAVYTAWRALEPRGPGRIEAPNEAQPPA